MSPRDVVAELHAARVTAPVELRERVRLVAAAEPAPPRRLLPRRRWLVALVPVAAAAAAAGVVLTRPSHTNSVLHGQAVERAAAPRPVPPQSATLGKLAVPSSTTRVQRYGASLALRVANPAQVSDAVKRALHVVASLGGYPVSVHVSSAGSAGSGELVLKVPRSHVQEAIARLSQLGTIVGEQVDVQDLQGGINATDRTIARLQRQLAELRAEPQTDAITRQIAALTARIAGLQRARASTIRSAHYATIQLSISTRTVARPHHHGHGPLHGLGVAFRWIGIGLVYGLALGAPLVLVAALLWLATRALRRRREDALLSRR
jgi:Domain of unknown function (DUF4349)